MSETVINTWGLVGNTDTHFDNVWVNLNEC